MNRPLDPRAYGQATPPGMGPLPPGVGPMPPGMGPVPPGYSGQPNLGPQPVPPGRGPMPLGPQPVPPGGPVPVGPVPVPARKGDKIRVRTDRTGSTASGRIRQELEEEEESFGALAILLKRWIGEMPAWLASMAVNMVILLVLALLFIPRQQNTVTFEAVMDDAEVVPIDEIAENLTNLDTAGEETTQEPVPDAPDVNQIEVSPFHEEPAPPLEIVEFTPMSEDMAPRSDVPTENGVVTGRGFDGRGEAARAGLVRARGGTPGSEAAVAMALAWLKEHQSRDGSWYFDHNLGPCNGRCRNNGTLGETARLASTGMALLPFLGAGNTHKKGQYSDVVRRGLFFLINRMQITNNGGSLADLDGKMYGHGIATMALCEAYGMTQDKNLLKPAQSAIDFIGYAQDPGGGGWRYEPREPGDTSVLSWQMLAYKSGHMAYLNIPKGSVKKALGFLDRVQSDNGAKYGYTSPGEGSATTAIGLLCRMYTGWKHENDALKRGVYWLSERGPSKSNLYYNYYATQVMIQYNDPEMWPRWNEELREYLVARQIGGGHERGSWYFGGGDQGADVAGRLYCTCLATMILEVYYRHLPIYGAGATTNDLLMD